MNRDVNFRVALGMSGDYKLGARQIAEWRTRDKRLPKCKGCGRLIDGIIRRGFCVWCSSMNQAAVIEFRRAENEAKHRRRAIQRAKDAEKRARRKAREAAKEVAE